MQRVLTWLNAGPLGAVLRSRYYVPATLLLLVAGFAGTAGLLLLRAGTLSLPSARPRSDITITGPGVPGDSDQIQVYVLGAVVTPGVYPLSPDARVHDLVAAAGGATSDADLAPASRWRRP